MNITTFIIDCDGVLNDGKQAHVFHAHNQMINIIKEEPFHEIMRQSLEKPFKFFHSRDKTAIRYLTQTLGKRVIIVSADDSQITKAWAESCGAEFMHRRIKVFSDEDGINWSETVGIGDDLMDLPYLEKCVLAFCPADANQAVKATATTLNVNGGEGVISHLLWHLVGGLINGITRKKETARTKTNF